VTGGDDARVSGRSDASGRSGASKKDGASEKSLSSGTGVARRGGDDDHGGREARRRFGGKRLSADLESEGGLYRTPDLLSQVVFTTVTKGPLVSGRYDPRLKAPFCHWWPHDP
jgi:hypothetical protein